MGFGDVHKPKLCWPVLVVAVLAHRLFLYPKKHAPGFVDVIYEISGFLKSGKMRNLTRIWVHRFSVHMFDMDAFGGDKVPCTKHKNSCCRPEKLNN